MAPRAVEHAQDTFDIAPAGHRGPPQRAPSSTALRAAQKGAITPLRIPPAHQDALISAAGSHSYDSIQTHVQF
ncbi:MAG TPA: hypothetical protein VFV49_09840 [Thermoanaerobaculia bacterium]|nr:hypothetical protein [Thermoanaerobaculia bacterium]